MGWDFRGLYTVDTAATRARLAADELVRGFWAQIRVEVADRVERSHAGQCDHGAMAMRHPGPGPT